MSARDSSPLILVVDGRPVGRLEVADSSLARDRGLLGRDGIDGAFLLPAVSVVHTLGMRFPLDVAFCDADLLVRATVTMARHRVSRPRWRARTVLEAEAGAFARWHLRPGSQLAVGPDRGGR